MPNTIKIHATINKINPVGQKQEAASPSPNATAYRPVGQLLCRRNKLTAHPNEIRLISFVLS
jgi:hypothetical protein